MKILVACEESQAVTIELRKLGHEAYSCDIQDCSGGHPEWHIKEDALKEAYSGKYDMMIAHPPCTYLSNSGVCWLYKQEGRWDKMREGANFFKKLMEAPIDKIAIENPVMHKYAVEIIGKRQDCSVQPYEHGHAESKRTCFWLKNLNPLIASNDVKEEWENKPKKEGQRLHYLPPGPERAKLRSKTFPGIAKAMAEQWAGKYGIIKKGVEL